MRIILLLIRMIYLDRLVIRMLNKRNTLKNNYQSIRELILEEN